MHVRASAAQANPEATAETGGQNPGFERSAGRVAGVLLPIFAQAKTGQGPLTGPARSSVRAATQSTDHAKK
jgi:hypothetical protein